MQGDIATIQYSADEILEKQFCLLAGGYPVGGGLFKDRQRGSCILMEAEVGFSAKG